MAGNKNPIWFHDSLSGIINCLFLYRLVTFFQSQRKYVAVCWKYPQILKQTEAKWLSSSHRIAECLLKQIFIKTNAISKKEIIHKLPSIWVESKSNGICSFFIPRDSLRGISFFYAYRNFGCNIWMILEWGWFEMMSCFQRLSMSSVKLDD